MEKYDEIYKYLTGVDIKKETDLWDERGKGYYGEFLVFCELLDSLPAPSKILMNVHVPTGYGTTTEVDLLAITPVGIIVYEVKHYKGTIYGSGDGQKWTQYFKTEPNKTFLNPIKQNAYHCSALSAFTSAPIFSVVVFTNDQCKLKLNRISSPVCDLYNVADISNNIISINKGVLSPFDIDELFNKLAEYSKMTSPITPDGDPMPFHKWIYAYHDAYMKYYEEYHSFVEVEKTRLLQRNEEERVKYSDLTKKAYERYTRKLKLKWVIEVSLVAVAVTAAILCAVFAAPIQKSLYSAELSRISENYNDEMSAMKLQLEEMRSKFRKIEKHGEIPISYALEATNLTMKETAENNMVLSFYLEIKDDTYLIRFHGNSSLIVGRKDGTVREYYFFSEIYRGKGEILDFQIHRFNRYYTFNPSLLTDTKPDDVSYIKLTGLNLYEFTSTGNTNLIDENAELLIYDSDAITQ